MEERLCICGDAEDAHVDGEGMCAQCKCMEFQPVCELCGGTGEVPTYYRDDSTGYNWVEDGTKPCICQLEDND